MEQVWKFLYAVGGNDPYMGVARLVEDGEVYASPQVLNRHSWAEVHMEEHTRYFDCNFALHQNIFNMPIQSADQVSVLTEVRYVGGTRVKACGAKMGLHAFLATLPEPPAAKQTQQKKKDSYL